MKAKANNQPICTGSQNDIIIPFYNVSVSKLTDSSYRPYHIYFNDVKSLKHWFVSLDAEYLKNHDIVLTYE